MAEYAPKEMIPNKVYATNTADATNNTDTPDTTLSQDGTDPQLIRLKKIAVRLTFLAAAAFVVFFFVNANNKLPYTVLAALCLVLPLIALYLYFRYGAILSLGNQKINENRNLIESTAVYLGAVVLLPSFIGLIRLSMDFKIMEGLRVAIWAIVVAAAVLLGLLLLIRKHKKRGSVIFLVALLLLPTYACAAVLQINHLLDSSSPETYTSEVLYTSSDSRYLSYSFTARTRNGDKITFSHIHEDIIRKINVKRKPMVEITEHQGFLKIPTVSFTIPDQ
jgi:hypothetical protein